MKTISPLSIFIYSSFIFILNRPLSWLFFDEELVSSGFGGSVDIYYLATAFAFTFFLIFLASFYFFKKSSVRFEPMLLNISYIKKPWFRISFLTLISLLLLYFLVRCYQLFGVVEGNYLDFVGGDIIHGHFWIFFLAKNAIFLYLVFGGRSSDVNFLSIILMLASFGFLLVSIRGYFIYYLVLALYFFQMKFRLAWWVIPIFALLSIFGLVYIGMSRVGINTSDWSASDFVKIFIYGQSSSFEQVYGAVGFRDEINSCLSIYGAEFISKCIDTSRGVFFDIGGFGTSVYAEAFLMLGWLGLFFAIPIGFLIAWLQSLHYKLANSIDFPATTIAASVAVLFYFVPSLVSIARGSLLEFLIKGFFFFICFHFLLPMVPSKRRIGALNPSKYQKRQGLNSPTYGD